MKDIAWLTARPIAHRGFHAAASGRIENSMSAFAAAKARGFNIELDVHLSDDGVVYVFHDDVLDRLTEGHGPVAGKTYAEIGQAIFISPRTVEHHVASIRRRLDATSRSDLIAKLRLTLGSVEARP